MKNQQTNQNLMQPIVHLVMFSVAWIRWYSGAGNKISQEYFHCKFGRTYPILYHIIEDPSQFSTTNTTQTCPATSPDAILETQCISQEPHIIDLGLANTFLIFLPMGISFWICIIVRCNPVWAQGTPKSRMLRESSRSRTVAPQLPPQGFAEELRWFPGASLSSGQSSNQRGQFSEVVLKILIFCQRKCRNQFVYRSSPPQHPNACQVALAANHLKTVEPTAMTSRFQAQWQWTVKCWMCCLRNIATKKKM